MKRLKTITLATAVALCLGATGVSYADQTTSYTYHSTLGLVETIDGPRTDVTDVITFGYDVQGNRTSITNALSQMTQITAFDPSGRPLSLIDANNATTTLTYDARGRLKTRITGTQLTQMDYDAVGNLIKVTQGDGSVIHYDYDDAHRLIGIRDGLNNKISYELDVAGNRKKEEVFDPSGQLKRSHSSIYDELSRLKKSIGANNQTSEYSYDGNSNMTGSLDPNLNPTTQAFDVLDRLEQTTDARSGVTLYGYDARDNLTSVTDPEGLTTTYVYNAYDNLTSQTSPDTGLTTYTYDDAGNRLTKTDARNVTASYTYDALNRVETITFPNSALNITYTYDQGTNGIGRLTQMQDGAGVSQYSYDLYGNLITHNRSQGNNAWVTEYTYDDANRLSGITYPSGRDVTYLRNGNGQITSVESTESGQPTQVIASNISYAPFGGAVNWTYGNGLSASINLDLDYQTTEVTIDAIMERRYDFDPVGNISAITNLLDSAKNQALDYDELNRLVDADGGYGDLDYGYDAVGNRTSLSEDTQQTNYSYDTTSHQLLTHTGATTESRQYDEMGNTKQIGSDLFVYDDTGRLAQAQVGATTANYAFNGSGERVTKTVGSEVTHFVYNQSGQLIAELDGSGVTQREFIYLNGTVIGQVAQGTSGGGGGSEIVLDNPEGSFTGWWPALSSGTQFEGSDYRYHAESSAGVAYLGRPIDNLSASYTGTWHSWAGSTNGIQPYYLHNMQYHPGTVESMASLGTPVDNTQASFVGTWHTGSSVEGNGEYIGNNIRFAYPGSGSKTATWTANVPSSGSYDVYATWTQYSSRATNAKYTIHHNSGSDTVTVDQQTNGSQWNYLGTYTMDGASAITLSDDANGTLLADAVTMLPAGTTPVAIPDQGNIATWALNASTPGNYDVYATWPEYTSYATNAKFTVHHSTGSDTVTVNQQTSGSQWNLLGTYALDSNSTLSLSSVANGYVIADAVTILPAGTPPVVTPIGDSVSWTPSQTGEYQVYAKWVDGSNRATNATYTIEHNGGSTAVNANQQENGGQWNLLGTYTFNSNSLVTLSAAGNGLVIADSIRLVSTSGGTTPAGLYYVHNDHLGTPQVMTDENGAVVWQGEYRPFGLGAVSTNTVDNPLRFPGQYYDEETGFYYNYFRTYDPSTGRYLESDPIGLGGGINTYAYVYANPIKFSDPTGLYTSFWHNTFSTMGGLSAGLTSSQAADLAGNVVAVDHNSYVPGTQDPMNAHMHAMCAPGKSRDQCQEEFLDYVNQQIGTCNRKGLAKAIHAYQDFYAKGHGPFREYNGLSTLPPSHLYGDTMPSREEVIGVPIITRNLIRMYQEKCKCEY